MTPPKVKINMSPKKGPFQQEIVISTRGCVSFRGKKFLMKGTGKYDAWICLDHFRDQKGSSSILGTS